MNDLQFSKDPLFSAHFSRESHSLYISYEMALKNKKRKKKVGGEVFQAEYLDYQQQNYAKNGC